MTTVDTLAARESVDSANRAFESTFRSQDSAALAALYTRNATLLPPGREPITGTDGIRAFWQAVFDAGIRQVRLTTNELEALGDSAIEVGSYELMGESSAVLDRGKYIVIWRKESTHWRLHQDIWNTSIPAA